MRVNTLALGSVLAAATLMTTWPTASARPKVPGVVDLHVDLPYQITAKGRPASEGSGQYMARWLEAAGVRGAVLPLYVPKDVHPDGPQMADLERVYRDASAALNGVRPWVVNHTGGPCDALRQGVGTAAFFSFEGATPLGFDPSSVERWVSRGVRLFGLVHAYDTPLASSSGYTFRTPAYGLTRRGKELVRRIAAHGGIVDVSHASDEAIRDVLQLAKARGSIVVASHSNARAVAPHPRNLTDAQLRAIAESGGVVGIAFHAPFLTNSTSARISDVVRHILHVRQVAGIGAVALGSDFEGGIRPPAKLGDVRGFLRLAEALRQAGLTQQEVEQVFGRNAERVLCQSARER
jgi:membrane dipeptidase